MAVHKQTLMHQVQLTWRKTKSFSAATQTYTSNPYWNAYINLATNSPDELVALLWSSQCAAQRSIKFILWCSRIHWCGQVLCRCDRSASQVQVLSEVRWGESRLQVSLWYTGVQIFRQRKLPLTSLWLANMMLGMQRNGWCRTEVSNSGQGAKFGLHGGLIWPTMPYVITARAGLPGFYKSQDVLLVLWCCIIRPQKRVTVKSCWTERCK